MPKDPTLRKVMVIGSGPIVIGQAAEFDYSGTQACRALREEGVEVVLINSNPATIMTDTSTADRVYIEPLTVEYAASVIARERPDALLPTLGGQVGLNLAMELGRSGVLERYGVRLLGTPPEAIEKAEDREAFRELMLQLGEPIADSRIVRTVEEAASFADAVGYPLITRPAYTLGGTGGGIAYNGQELLALVKRGLAASPVNQVLVEESLLGWKEIEFEVLRDGADNCIIVCSMENVDPVGVHTGDSIVVAPALTLTPAEMERFRTSALRIIRALGIQGGCNIQYALSPDGAEYRVIEVNPRVSRSSALASKATGYPIAKVSAKVALGLTLDEIHNTAVSTAAVVEPVMDYIAVKIPRWPFDKFGGADRRLGTQMKATGEVMALERTFEAALLKAVRSLEINLHSLEWPPAKEWDDEALLDGIRAGDDRRLFLLAECLRRGRTVAELAELTAIDEFFISKLQRVVQLEEKLRNRAELDAETLRAAKRLGLSDARIAALTGRDEKEVRRLRLGYGIRPSYKMVDTTAGQLDAATYYFYATYEDENEAVPSGRPTVVVLGSGPIRIGQGIEFDYSSVHAVRTLRSLGYDAVIINNNPETVSTDFDIADRLYFEPLTPEDVLNVLDLERPLGVIPQFGGQTAINLAAPLAEAGVTILGTDLNSIDLAETRERFDQLLDQLGIQRPGGAAASAGEAHDVARRLGFPVMVRPSYVLGGRAMEVVHDEEELTAYLTEEASIASERPIWIDRYIEGMELEVDAASDGETVIIPGVMQHIERAGVHSGDSIAVLPPLDLPGDVIRQVEDITIRIARALKVRGILNMQLVYDGRELYVLEVNPRASRTVPFLIKATGIPLVELATRAAVGENLAGLGFRTGLVAVPPFVSVKLPVFSWSKLPGVDAALGPEMKSTGEVMAIDDTFTGALRRGLIAAGLNLPRPDQGVLLTIADRQKAAVIPLARDLQQLGYRLYATEGTQAALKKEGIDAIALRKLDQPRPNLGDALQDGTIRLVINAITEGSQPARDGFRIRRMAVERGIPCLTSLDTAAAIVKVLKDEQLGPSGTPVVRALQDLVGYSGRAGRDDR